MSWSLAHVIVQLSHGLHFSNKKHVIVAFIHGIQCQAKRYHSIKD